MSAPPLHVCFNSPQSGWMSFELRAGAQHFVEAVSYTPYDSLLDLTNALATLLRATTDTSVTVSWGINPDELDFIFTVQGAEVALEVVWYSDDRRAPGTGETVFSFRGSELEVCLPFWRALRELQASAEVDEFARNWRHEFPARALQELTGLVAACERADAAADL